MIIDMVKRYPVISQSSNHHIYGIDMLLINKSAYFLMKNSREIYAVWKINK